MIRLQRKSSHHLQGRRGRGFSLVEVMVALVIIAVGMLGIAKMHALAVESTSSAGSRALVAIEAAGMAAAMHADRNYWTGLGGSNLTTTGYFAPGVSPTISISASDNCTATMSTSSPCSSQDIAAYDVLNFINALAQILPAANATIVCQNTTLPLSCTITVTWLEESPGLSAQTNSAAMGSAVTVNASTPLTGNMLQQPQYTLYVEP